MGMLGAGVVIVAAFITLGRYQENWVEYRTTCESLRHEKYRYLTRTGLYSGDNAFSVLVDGVESLISKETPNGPRPRAVLRKGNLPRTVRKVGVGPLFLETPIGDSQTPRQ